MANLTINGKTINVDVEDDTPLLWAIRENVGLTGTKYGCGIAQCGACTVHIDGVAVRSCGMPVERSRRQADHHDRGPRRRNGALHKVQQAWVANDVPQCGYCQCGMIMAVAALLKDKPKPTDQTSTRPSPISAAAGPSSRFARRSTPPRTLEGGRHEQALHAQTQSPRAS